MNGLFLLNTHDIIAVHKPPGLSAIPERRPETICLQTQLEKELGHRLFVVHRLDKPVSGVMVFAKTAAAHRYLNTQFSSRKVQKTYLALTHGRIPKEMGTIDAPIRQFGSGRMGVDTERGKDALTRYEVLASADAFTLVKACPVTGRRHQIRVHLYSLGYPIVGDLSYGDKQLQSRFPRLMLHAWQIGFDLPSGDSVHLECPPPEDFQTFVAEHVGAKIPCACA